MKREWVLLLLIIFFIYIFGGASCCTASPEHFQCNLKLNHQSGYQVPTGWEEMRENFSSSSTSSCPEQRSCQGCASPFKGYVTSNRDIYPLYLDEWNPCPRYPVKEPECEKPEFEYRCPKALVCPPQPCTDLNIREPCVGF